RCLGFVPESLWDSSVKRRTSGQIKVPSRLGSRLNQGENPSNQGGSRLIKVIFFLAAETQGGFIKVWSVTPLTPGLSRLRGRSQSPLCCSSTPARRRPVEGRGRSALRRDVNDVICMPLPALYPDVHSRSFLWEWSALVSCLPARCNVSARAPLRAICW